jgi:putative ABC transport system permease protein
VSLRRYTWRSMQQRPGRTILTMLSIVIGVTAAVAVGLGTASTRNAYKQMFAMVTGRATLEVDAAGGGGFPDDVFEKVATLPGIKAATPLIDRPGSLSLEGGERRVRLQLLGIDPERDSSVRDYEIISGHMVKDGDELALEEGFANYLGLKVGDEVKLLTTRLSKPFQVAGLFRPKAGAALAQSAMGFLPLKRAQYHFNPRGKSNLIDKIQIVTADDVDVDQIQAKVAAVLPDDVKVHRPAASTQLMRETLLSTEQGLKLTTGFSLLMAAFIIINTFFMNVTERRRHLSIMRAVGATRKQVRWSLLSEALLLGLIGTLIGMLLGVSLAYIGTNVVARAFSVQLPRLVEVITPWPFVTAFVFGMGTAFAGAFVPAILAGLVSPLEGMNRAVKERNRSFTLFFLIAGFLLTLISSLVIAGSIYGFLPIDRASDLAWLFLIGVVFLNAVIMVPQATAIAGLLKYLFPVESRLALKQVLRHQMRSVLTKGVLFIVGATGVGMANSILDCVNDVHEWYDQAIVGDYFIRAMMPDMATGTAADLPESAAVRTQCRAANRNCGRPQVCRSASRV